ncbi:hypothetical protein H012_gp739 [Acanthamoeba polyphaga moumouvirus]|uniref:Uncharacterized protein n=2 Tax=Moumouvirus TaxID=3080801 RepID=L7RC12_9VIRU|nr:hypothetical protein H012_gp739 [Acanthamoeba polyphaga moumouvirus]AEX63106.1 hypothetical protein mv_L904 [Moumouvirus Monve]AGC01726.1 hypothetical protein Moumou_00182 [Acanthamoeba polyphaga moumouvirus]AQN68072.1 hypothetical protein [Saudi moumouvirus]
MNISYRTLLKNLSKINNIILSIKNNYLIITLPNNNYHITIFQDQWDDYQKQINKPYHLFHISSNDTKNKCSSYFWVYKKNYKIYKIPNKYFKYNQPNYSFFTSTRNPCSYLEIKTLLKYFGRILSSIHSYILDTNNSKYVKFSRRRP